VVRTDGIPLSSRTLRAVDASVTIASVCATGTWAAGSVGPCATTSVVCTAGAPVPMRAASAACDNEAACGAEGAVTAAPGVANGVCTAGVCTAGVCTAGVRTAGVCTAGVCTAGASAAEACGTTAPAVAAGVLAAGVLAAGVLAAGAITSASVDLTTSLAA